MSEKQRLPNPFECARPLGGIFVTLTPENVMDVCPGMSKEAVENLLREHATVIGAMMFSAGMEAAAQIIYGGGGDA